MKRTHTCGELTIKDINKEVVLEGWVHSRRDHGGLIFIDLRDRFGLTQLVFNSETVEKGDFQKANSLRDEFVIRIYGKVFARDKEAINPKLNTGEIEILMDSKGGILKISYSFRPIDEDEVATYPTKSVELAINLIQRKEGELIIPFDGIISTSINVKKVISAYRILKKDQEYLQPVYVFEGNDNNGQSVTVITPAIEDQYLETKEESEN